MRKVYLKIARAIHSNCRCPKLKFEPFSATNLSDRDPPPLLLLPPVAPISSPLTGSDDDEDDDDDDGDDDDGSHGILRICSAR